MNEPAKAELDRILSLDPADLSEAEQGFLQARRSYMTEEQRIKFGIAEASADNSQDEQDETPRRRSRKASSDEVAE